MKEKSKFETNNNLNCPICFNNKWYMTGIRKQNILNSHWESKYLKIRKHIFFNIWNQSKPVVEMKRGVCKKCGFVIDFPRPSEKDITKKYQYLAIVKGNIGSTKDMSRIAKRYENKQAIKILSLTKDYSNNNKKSLDILDCGGGDGHLLLPMKEKGNNCYLIDYNKFPVKGVVRLGNTSKDIPKGYKFDLIICRHVLEHMASPKKFINDFKQYLKEGGIVFAEVPIELCNAPKPSIDPVTHINFFQEMSFRILFEIAGFKILLSRKKLTTYHGDPLMVAQVLATKESKQKRVLYKGSYKRTLDLMNASFFSCLKSKIFNPILFTLSIIRLLRSNFKLVIIKIYEKIIPNKIQ